MHKLDLLEAFLYWIPTISIIIVMVTVLSYSFWRYHKKKERSRKSQREYLEMALSVKRPRIGALRCYTHSDQPLDMMQSFSASSNSEKGLKHLMRLQSKFGNLGPVHEEYNESWTSKMNYYQVDSDSDTPRSIMKDLSLYEDTFNHNPKSSSTKRSKHSIDYDDYDLTSEIKKSKERKRKRKKKRRNQIWMKKLQNDENMPSGISAIDVQNRLYQTSSFTQNRLDAVTEGGRKSGDLTTWSNHRGQNNDHRVPREKKKSALNSPPDCYQSNSEETSVIQSLNNRVAEEKIFWVKTDDVKQSSI